MSNLDKNKNGSYWLLSGKIGNETGPIEYGNTVVIKNIWGSKNSCLNTCSKNIKDSDKKCLNGIKYKVNTSKNKNAFNTSWVLLKDSPVEDLSINSNNNLIMYKYNVNFCLTLDVDDFNISKNEIMPGTRLSVTKYLVNKNDNIQKWIYQDGYIKLKNNINLCITIRNNIVKNGSILEIDYIAKPNNAKYYSQQWVVENNIIKHKNNKKYAITLKHNKLSYPNQVVLNEIFDYGLITDAMRSQKWITPKSLKIENKCSNYVGWFNPFSKNYLDTTKHNLINSSFKNDCQSKCYNNKNCDFYTIDSDTNKCNLYNTTSKSILLYSNKPFNTDNSVNNGKNYGKVKKKSICENKINMTFDDKNIKNINICNQCTFPEFKHKQNNCNDECCPESWYSNKYGAKKGESCGTNSLKSKSKNCKDPIQSCEEIGGHVIQTKVFPEEYQCTKKYKKGILHEIKDCTQCGKNWCGENNINLIIKNFSNIEDEYILGKPFGNDWLSEFNCSQMHDRIEIIKNEKDNKMYVLEKISINKPSVSLLENCNDCNRIDNQWCNDNFNLSSNKLTEYYNIAPSLKQIGCKNVDKSWTGENIKSNISVKLSNNKKYAVMQTKSNILNSGGYLLPNQYLECENKKYKMKFDNNGDFYITNNKSILWKASETFNDLYFKIKNGKLKNSRMFMYLNGDLCIKNNSDSWCLGKYYWNDLLDKNDGNGNYLIIKEDGKLIIFSKKGKILWNNNMI